MASNDIFLCLKNNGRRLQKWKQQHLENISLRSVGEVGGMPSLFPSYRNRHTIISFDLIYWTMYTGDDLHKLLSLQCAHKIRITFEGFNYVLMHIL